jgi:hypothetical protein
MLAHIFERGKKSLKIYSSAYGTKKTRGVLFYRMGAFLGKKKRFLKGAAHYGGAHRTWY